MLDSLFNKVEKETPTQVFFCEMYESFKTTFFEEYLRGTASVGKRVIRLLRVVTQVTRRVLR